MDQIHKALKKLTPKERLELQSLLALISTGQLDGLDVKKLVGQEDIYRVRKGDLRIIFARHQGEIHIRALERRSSNTYKR